MHVEREFHPVKITLETEFEVRVMHAAVKAYGERFDGQHLRMDAAAQVMCEILLTELGKAKVGVLSEP
jgi:hypothetical protein